MCGICGKVNLDGQAPVDADLVRRMSDTIRHRGPDGSGEYIAGPVGLGHRRLSIIDLNTGDQPMSNEDGTVWLVFNGEIYNYLSLREDLQARGHRFGSTSDTEVIVHLYEELGEKCVERLSGMFAFALWDQRKQSLLIARDRVGIKPLYYYNTGKSLLFASEIKAILADPAVARHVNARAIDRFLTYYYLPGGETLIQGLYKLAPGHYLTAQGGRVKTAQYWDLRFPRQPRKVGFDDAVNELRAMLRRTVADHMLSDVPVGVLLSGGTDSTGVLRYAVEQTDKPIQTFTIGFEGRAFADERPYARLAARLYGTEHHEITMSADDFSSFLPKYVQHMEEPVFEPPAVALYYLAELARRSSVKVLLSGEGGDEAFGGYQNYRNLLMLERLKRLFGRNKAWLRKGFRLLDGIGGKNIGRYADFVDQPFSQYYFSRSATPFSPFARMKTALYTDDFTAALGAFDPGGCTRRLFETAAHQSLLNQMLYIDAKTWLPDDLLVKADKMTMAASVELRVPLLDYQVLQYAAELPDHFKVKGWLLKRLLKAALKDSVPAEILNRKKTGFPVPYDDWIRNEMKEMVYDTLLSRNGCLQSYFKHEVIRTLVERHQRGEGFSQEIFCLVALELWHQQFIGNRGAKSCT